MASKHNEYVLAGAEMTCGRVTRRFNFSYVNYRDLFIRITEYANWNRFNSGLSKLDHSLHFVLHAEF